VVQVLFGIKTSRSERQWSSYEVPPTEGQRVEFSRVSPTMVTGRYRGQDWHRALRPRGLISKFRVSLYGVVSSLFHPFSTAKLGLSLFLIPDVAPATSNSNIKYQYYMYGKHSVFNSDHISIIPFFSHPETQTWPALETPSVSSTFDCPGVNCPCLVSHPNFPHSAIRNRH